MFNASTTYWPRLLDAAIGPVEPEIQQMTRNLLNRLSGTNPQNPTTTTTAAPTTTVEAMTTTAHQPRRTRGTHHNHHGEAHDNHRRANDYTRLPRRSPPGVASQSSTNGGAVASRAIDGNTNGNFGAGSVSQTLSSYQPWWQIDLGSVRTIPSMTIYNRTDCCSNALTNFAVFVSQVPFTNPESQSGVTWSNYGGTVGNRPR